MRILLTGSSGRLGAPLAEALTRGGDTVVAYDRVDGKDVLDVEALAAAANGCDAVVHSAGLPDDRGAADPAVMELNLLGTHAVLRAAVDAGVGRVVCFSSGKALGMVHRPPPYLPLDDEAAAPSFRAYGLAKWLAEEMCRVFTEETGIATICLRPVAVLAGESDYERFAMAPARGPGLGAFIDLADVVAATRLALCCPRPGHLRALLAAAEIGGEESAPELVARLFAGVPWRGDWELEAEPRRSLVECLAARDVLGFRPSVGWPRPVPQSPARASGECIL